MNKKINKMNATKTKEYIRENLLTLKLQHAHHVYKLYYKMFLSMSLFAVLSFSISFWPISLLDEKTYMAIPATALILNLLLLSLISMFWNYNSTLIKKTISERNNEMINGFCKELISKEMNDKYVDLYSIHSIAKLRSYEFLKYFEYAEEDKKSLDDIWRHSFYLNKEVNVKFCSKINK